MRASIATEPGSAKANEDWAGVTNHAAVVLDGVTAPADLGTGCTHTTPWYVRTLGAFLLSTAEADPGIPLANVLAEAIRQVAALHENSCDLTHPGTPSTTVALAREHDDALEYLVLSDATIVIDGQDGIEVITDKRVEDVAAAEREAAQEQPPGTPERQRLMHRLVTEQRRHKNRPGGYWVAGADPEAAKHAVTGVRENVRRAALLTDGAAVLAADYGLVGWEGLLDVLGIDGSAGLIERVRQAEARDPQACRWPRYKPSDDAAAVYLEFGQVAGVDDA